MNRFLHWFNFLGVLALAALCVAQWRVNRTLNLALNEHQKASQQQAVRLAEQERQIKGGASDLDSFRDRISLANTAMKEAEGKAAALDRQVKQLTNERDQLKTSVTNWAAAVATRDERLKQSGAELAKLGDDRNDAVRKFNELAAQQNKLVGELERRAKEHSAVVEEMNKRTLEHNRAVVEMNKRAKDFNELVDKYNALAKQLEGKPPAKPAP